MESKYTWPEGEPIVYLRPPKEEYHGKLPNFYPPEWFPELDILAKNWEAIRDEILEFEKHNGYIKGMSYFSSPAETVGAEKWSTINLMSYYRKLHSNRKKFPLLTGLTDQIDNITTVTISVLPPKTDIKPHYGDTNGIIRAHLGLVVPDHYPITAIKVGNEERGWEDGKLLLFTVVCQHEVWSKSEHRRYVLIVDFVPKLLQHKMVEICAKTLGSQSYIFFYKKLALVRKFPEPVADFFCYLFYLIWRIYLPIQRTFPFLY
ncbi:MAG: aspartyl/asparaginyl beta-hydroxylase domain-containing protein [Bacteroidia bacterium]|nr:aspartyl/asparaginyl beta-hydroxylase domain-containing protein [Bacteroidia bacterium]